MSSRLLLVAVGSLATLCAAPASAREWRVAMVNRGANGSMDFTPAFLRISPGDTVRFVAQDKSHNAESIASLTPPGGTLFKGAMNRDVVARFVRPGLYGYKCLPHFAMGMVGLIQVGKPVNKPAIAAALGALPPLARVRISKFLQMAK